MLSRVRIFATLDCSTPGYPVYHQLPQLLKHEFVMPSNHPILCHPLLLPLSIFPSIRVFSNELVLCIRWPSFGVSASASVLPMNIQDWFPLGWTGWISLQPKGLSRVFSNTTGHGPLPLPTWNWAPQTKPLTPWVHWQSEGGVGSQPDSPDRGPQESQSGWNCIL